MFTHKYFRVGLPLVVAAAFAAITIASGNRAQAEYQFVNNGDFASNVNGWANQQAGFTIVWDGTADANGDPSSGGAAVTTSVLGVETSSFTQCVDIVPGISYTASADARVPFLDNSPGSFIFIFPVYFTNNICGSSTAGSMMAPTTGSQFDGFQHLATSAVAPPTAQSILMQVFLHKGTQNVAARGFVDNISIVATGNADFDACSDGEELGPDPAFGGDRNPNNGWDFFDVTGDRAIDLSDTTAILAKFGLQPGNQGYDELFDRWAPDAQKPYRTAQADVDHAGIDLGDALVSLQSFGHSCAA